MANAPFTTGTDIPNPVNVQLQRALLAVAEAQCPYFAGTSPAIVQGGQGTALTAKWRRFNNLTPATTPLTALTGNVAFPTRASSQQTVTDLTATLQKFGDFILLNEEVDLINIPDQNSMGISKALGIQAGRTLNILQRNEMEDNATARFAGGVAAVGSVVTALAKADVDHVVNWIQRNNGKFFMDQTFGSDHVGTVTVEPAYKGICHPDVEEDIRNMSNFNSASQYGEHTRLERFEFGKTGRVRWVSSSDAGVTADAGGSPANNDLRHTTTAGSPDSADIYDTVIYAEDAVGSVGLDTAHIQESYRAGDQLPGVMMIRHERGSAGVADPLNEAASIGWKSWHAAKILSDVNSESPAETLWIRNIRSGATAL